MDSTLHLTKPPPLDPAWLAHEQAAGLLLPKPVPAKPEPLSRPELYSASCKALNATLLSGRDEYLNHGISITNTTISQSLEGGGINEIPIRKYVPPTPTHTMAAQESGKPQEALVELDAGKMKRPVVIYYHGGGLQVGDLDSGDLSCRRICLLLCISVISVDYRLMPQFTADDALSDSFYAFNHITQLNEYSEIILVGSSSGGQLAAQVSQIAASKGLGDRIKGVLLRAPVTCDATNDGISLPELYRELHHSMNPEFHTSLLSSAALDSKNRTEEKLPLEVEDLKGLPKHWVQVCTNDIYYSDGVCYAEALKKQGVEVKLDVVVGYPHTFWLKAPLMDRAAQAEGDMIEGLRWLLE